MMAETFKKDDVVRKISQKTGLKMVDVKAVLLAFIDVVEESLADGNCVKLVGFGTFKTKLRKPKQARNVLTGEAIHIPGKIVPVFEVGNRLKRVASKEI